MKRFIADLHIHTCLSPCAELDMTPLRILRRAAERGLDIVAISDHNSAENIGVASGVASERGITLLPAMEVTSSEEVHILSLFGSLEAVLRMQEIVYENLEGEIGEDKAWGHQVVVNERDEVLDFNRKLLVGATRLGVKELVEKVHSLGGLAIASHADREAFGLVTQLGFIPEDLALDALEVTRSDENLGQPHIPRVMSSDAHRLEDIGRRTTEFHLESASFEEVAMALRGVDGRRVQCGPE
jgi:predicted metal-dependent phosphoesterase TrpH